MMKHNLHSRDSFPKIPLFHFFIRGYGVGGSLQKTQRGKSAGSRFRNSGCLPAASLVSLATFPLSFLYSPSD